MPRPPTLPDLRFLVVGADGAGKSTFMHHALDLKKSLQPPVASKKMSLEGDVFLISLVEVQLEDVDVDVDEEYAISWPMAVRSETAGTQIDGVLALYDISRRETLSGIPDLLNACSKGRIPCVLVACKCDLPLASKRIDPREVEKSCMKETGIEGCQTYLDKPDTHKRCISIVLRNVISNHSAAKSGVRSRAMTTPQAPKPHAQSSYAAPMPGHARATSEFTRHGGSGLKQVETTSSSPGSSGGKSRQPSITTPILDEIPQSPPLELHGDDVWATIKEVPDAPQSVPNQPKGLQESMEVLHADQFRRRRPGTPATIADSLIDGGRSEASDDDNDEEEASPSVSKANGQNFDSTDEGHSFDNLVGRLVSMQMSHEDYKFNAAFLCLYRKFAAPAQLLATIITRFETLNDADEPQLLILDSQLRLISTLARWIAEYPGDFSYPVTRQYLFAFTENLTKNRIFAAAVGEITSVLEVRAPDDDTGWAVSDSGRGETATIQSFPRVPYLTDLPRPTLDAKDDDEGAPSQDMASFVDSVEVESLGHTRISSSGFSGDRSESVSTTSFSTFLNSVEAAQRHAELLSPLSRLPLSKVQWHQLMEYTDDDIAREMTRIDWIMYSAIRPRDLIRHVSLSESKKESCRSLDHVNRMINHFNHVAFWTASMILLRDKAKHRAKMLERFMGVAWKLRQLNNYNSLGAIIAGINFTPVHRLTQTRELVETQLQRDFMRLEILMSTQKSHFAYRLAWENTIGEKIPFLPLHRRDLVSTETGNSTFVGSNKSRINWRKFQIMGDGVVSIQESQGMPYPNIPRNVDIQRLILDTKFAMDEDALFERSMQVESSTSSDMRRKLTWLSRTVQLP